MESKEYFRRPYVEVKADPSPSEFKKIIEGKRTILEVGCGETNPARGIYPRCSWKTDSPDIVWVGCDPKAIAESNGKVFIQPNQKTDPNNMIFFTREVDNLPPFSPNYISLVAPNPEDIARGLLYDLERFLNRSGQVVVIVLDNRTWESRIHGRQAIQEINRWARNNRFEVIESRKPAEFSPNSADLGISGNKWFVFKKR
ncbi:MAG: hypothetical protein KatS3mg088_701 [Patescibacteria group bacterium]|nr:MAG: hypothetical protein KatS3mg088_701 [Patescibacteria group bacterium]